ncbi:unnamed protein product [Durusdinium trenchii]|uniref:Uncharacterized protein n=2 Tax=Durusdinium trenchii TaxID=1381693 RepID=A0ABP0QZL0_9DINO
MGSCAMGSCAVRCSPADSCCSGRCRDPDEKRNYQDPGDLGIERIDVLTLPVISFGKGFWFRTDGSAVAQISDSLVIWDGGGASLLQQMGPTTITMEVEREVYVGEVAREAQPSILWNDGEQWLKK